ncbi:hypothetical protein [Nocardioides euryhalodurans]|uniref:Uncharacterized protein n=1 Tax=Nocardioides euryhalodurans TaxID=2518370 RepID=A0A4P7GK24_9ACTN|nr:hypothetical protein [Nocardioides euryhalodurans]QBR92273.1 hypothetical protein EXE57_08210 [Nocardioides euryhalodurans]
MTFQPTIRSQADLEAAWRTLMEPLGFASHSVWMMLIDAGDRPIPQLTKIDEAEDAPTDAELAGLADVLTTVQAEFAPGGQVAFLRSRPGSGGLTAVDRAWASALYEVGRLTGIPVAVVHRACDVDLVPVPMDEGLAKGA